MDECKRSIQDLDGEEDLIVAAKHIVKALCSKKKLTDDEKKILSDLGSQLSTLTTRTEDKQVESSDSTHEIEERLNVIQKTILRWETDESMIWDLGVEEGTEYLNAADEARKLTEELESLCLNGDDSKKELLRMAHNVLQMAMARLEEEFKHILIQNKLFYEPEHMSFRSSEEDAVESCSVISLGDESVESSLRRDSVGRVSEEFIIDLVQRDVLDDLRCIANLMLLSNYGHECSQAYITVRRDALDECLQILEMEKLSIEDVLKLEWGNLNSKIKRWIRAMRTFVRIYLASEKWLCEQIFGDLGMVNLVEASKASMLQLLNFGDAVCIGPHKPEKLFPILNMYEVLVELLPDLDSLYSDETGSSVRTECQEVQRRLSDSVRAAFLEFENAIAASTSTSPFAGGGIHPLTKYVMNYIKTLTDYRENLNFLLQDETRVDMISCSPDTTPSMDEENNIESTDDLSPMAIHFHSIVSILECNLEEKSRLYRDAALHQVFLMNNLHYMAQKVKNSELRHIFGDRWIKKCNGKFQQHAMNYERCSWSSILLLLKDEGNSLHSATRIPLKEKFRNFYLAFEEVYRTQTAWLIPDAQLREDLRISISLKVIQAYRTFLGRHRNHVSEKHIKYSADDLQNHLLELFEGSPRSMHSSHWR